MAEVKCGACKKLFTCDEVNPRTQQLYKSCKSCRLRNSKTDWKAVVFGKQPDNVSSDTESNATEHTLSPEEIAVEQVEQVEQVDKVTTTHAL